MEYISKEDLLNAIGMAMVARHLSAADVVEIINEQETKVVREDD